MPQGVRGTIQFCTHGPRLLASLSAARALSGPQGKTNASYNGHDARLWRSKWFADLFIELIHLKMAQAWVRCIRLAGCGPKPIFSSLAAEWRACRPWRRRDVW